MFLKFYSTKGHLPCLAVDSTVSRNDSHSVELDADPCSRLVTAVINNWTRSIDGTAAPLGRALVCRLHCSLYATVNCWLTRMIAKLPC